MGPEPRLTQNSKKAGTDPGIESDRNRTVSRFPRIKRPYLNISREAKIAEVEDQLKEIDELVNLETKKEEPSSQSRRYSSKMGDHKTMVLPGSRDAPRFASNRPRELRRFIRQMEDLWKESRIDSDREKKESIGKYADQESEEEWTALTSYGEGYTWEDFKNELLNNYPEASAAERGTPTRIRQIVAEAGNIELGDTVRLYAYRRAFLAEANKLKRPPEVMSNRELVELFMGGLSVNMGHAILQHLGNNARKDSGKENETKTVGIRRPEDRYDLGEVCRAAGEASENAQGMLSYKWGSINSGTRKGSTLVQTTTEESSNLVNKLNTLEEVQAQEKDRLDVANKQWAARFDAIESLIKKIGSHNPEKPTSNFVQNVGQSMRTGNYTEMSGRNYNNTSNTSGSTCYGCGESGHFQNNCERVKTLISKGSIIYNREGRVCLPDGSRVPNIPMGASLIDRVERYYSTMKQSQSFYGAFEEMEERLGGTMPRETSQVTRDLEDREAKIERLEKELALRERESTLKAKQLKLESVRIDDEISALREDKAGFR